MSETKSDVNHADTLVSIGETAGTDGHAIGAGSIFSNGGNLDEGNMYKEDDMEENWSPERKSKTYPADCYSFLALHGPFDNPKLFAFGMMVWLFQITFFILMVLRVAILSQNEDLDNPDKGFFARFMPANISVATRVTQFMALLSYCIFADESLKDIVKAVELFPRWLKAKPEDKARCMAFSCALRFMSGTLATVVVLLLVVTTSNIIEIILNFTAVNFISAFDDCAFELAESGKYGVKCKAEAKRIEELILPDCFYRKYDHVRYVYTIFPIAIVLLIFMTCAAVSQDLDSVWFTKRLRVQFKDGTLFEDYSGCYDLDRESTSWFRKREDYKSFEANPKSAKFGYCNDKHNWILYEGNYTNACDVDGYKKIAYSAKTFSYDISSTFENSWYSRSGRPLEFYFFDEDDRLDDGQCSSFLGDGICNSDFNDAEYDYDAGDCCAATCDETSCGIGSMTRVFNTTIVSGNGFPLCDDPIMTPLTIRLNDVFVPAGRGSQTNFGNEDVQPREPVMVLDCNNKNILTISINMNMTNKLEKVMVADGANCVMMIRNSTLGNAGIWYVDYTVFHGDESSIDSDPIVIVNGNSFVQSLNFFRRIEDCFLVKLEDHINKTTVYTGTDPSNQAISWLMKDSSGFSSCERDEFLERYALAVVNFAAPVDTGTNNGMVTKVDDSQLWISIGRHCVWQAVGCTGGAVTELNYNALSGKKFSGTIATEIGLLKNLTSIGMDGINLYGSIPSEIGKLNVLKDLSINDNYLTGSIPTEIGALTNLEFLSMHHNLLSGPIPSQVGKMTSLSSVWLWVNRLSGSIPSEIGELSSLFSLVLDGNDLTRTIPSTIAELISLNYLGMSYNSITGTIPSEFGQMPLLSEIILDWNALTGSVPSEILSKNLTSLNVQGNYLTDLIPVDGSVICPESEGEHYCDCKNHCLPDLDDPNYRSKCACEEGVACCDSFLEQFTECIICPDGGGFENPNSIISGTNTQTTCYQLGKSVRDDISMYGTKESCAEMAEYIEEVGCRCNGGSQFTECIICELENPSFYVEDYGQTCNDVSTYVRESLASFGTESQCIDARTNITAAGCTCKVDTLAIGEGPGVEEYIECVICEFDLEDPSLFVEAYGGTCNDISTYVRESLASFGTESQCVDARTNFTAAGCTCKVDTLAIGEGPGVEEYIECEICEFGLENPDFFLEDTQAACADASLYIKDNIADFGTKSVCDGTRIALLEAGCLCKGSSSDLEVTSVGI